ncbi:MAG TPA: PAS domain-containing protein [Stellaceae bacterium]|nr:PAS domain-containing protein [Stellaceae bacterium]
MDKIAQEYVDVTALTNPALRRLHEEWEARRRAPAFPARADFDPAEMRYIIGNLSLVEVRRHPLRFYYRVHATNISARTGFDMTHKFLDQYTDEKHRALILDHYLRSLDERRPIAARRAHMFTDRMAMLDCEALVVPLANDGTNIDMLMTGFVWSE